MRAASPGMRAIWQPWHILNTLMSPGLLVGASCWQLFCTSSTTLLHAGLVTANCKSHPLLLRLDTGKQLFQCWRCHPRLSTFIVSGPGRAVSFYDPERKTLSNSTIPLAAVRREAQLQDLGDWQSIHLPIVKVRCEGEGSGVRAAG